MGLTIIFVRLLIVVGKSSVRCSLSHCVLRMCFLLKNLQACVFLIHFNLGSIQELAVPSCKSLSSSIHPSGVYWIDPDGGSHANAFKVYCEMETDGGGWTLVWSYTFTDYEHFKAGTNAVVPRPNWRTDNAGVNVTISTTPPLNEHDYNAFEFSLWKRFGTEIFIKSNINNWLVCSPNGGSFVDWRRGSVDCKIVNHITDAECQDGSPPTRFQPGMPLCGPFFDRGPWAFYYYFDGCPGNGFPAHDPCGQTQDNGLKNVKNPHGNVFVR